MLENKIAELRKAKGISQEQLAEALNTTRQAVSKWERGESYPDVDRLKELAVYFNASIDYLLNYDVESISANRFIARLQKCLETKQFDIDLKQIQLVVSTHANNVPLLSAAVSYLVLYWTKHHDEAIADAIIEYSKRMLTLYRPEEGGVASLNELHRTIAAGYMMKEDYASARAHILENHVYGAEEYLVFSEIRLGHDEAASKQASNTFLESVSRMIDAQFIQLLMLLKSSDMQEALELAKWGVSFLASIQKGENSLLYAKFGFSFIQAICQRHLSIDNEALLCYLKENAEQACKMNGEADGLRFYYGEDPLVFVSILNDLKDYLWQTCAEAMKGKPAYESGLYIFNEVFGG